MKLTSGISRALPYSMSLVGSNQRNYFENANACIKRMLKTTVATQLKVLDAMSAQDDPQKFSIANDINLK